MSRNPRTLPIAPALAAALLFAPALQAAPAPTALVVCAPGYPGTTEQAQPTMDAFAAALAAAAGRPAGSVAAVYHETAEGGIARMGQADAALALVTLPFLLQNEKRLGLRPLQQAVRPDGPDETWSLAARKGRIAGPSALAGWEITGMPGYAPAFVRGPVLGAWGRLPGDARITFTARALGALRRAAAGENVAVVLDAEQAAAIAALPFGGDLEIVARSAPLPGTILCAVGEKPAGPEAAALLEALPRLHESPAGAEALKAMRMVRFESIGRERIDALRRSFAEAGGAP